MPDLNNDETLNRSINAVVNHDETCVAQVSLDLMK